MRLPLPDTLPALFEEHGITDPGQRAMLTLASRTAAEADTAEDRGETRPVSVVAESDWQTAEAFWMAVGLMPPAFAWPWRDLENLVGSVLPGDVWVIGARTGDGKSTLIANMTRALIWVRRLISGLTVAPLEQSPAVFKLKLACLHLGYSIPAVFRREWWRIPDPAAQEKVKAAVAEQGAIGMRTAVRYCPADSLDRAGLQRLIEQAAEWHHRLVIIDHIHHMDHGERLGPEGIRQTLKLAKALARRHDLAVLFTAQIGRGDRRDRRRKFYPPDLEDLQGSSAIEQVADGVLLLYQPLEPGVKVGDIDAVLTGEREYATLFKPNAAAMLCGKHRLDGSVRHKAVELRYEDGRMLDKTPSWRESPPSGVTLMEQGDAYTPGED